MTDKRIMWRGKGLTWWYLPGGAGGGATGKPLQPGTDSQRWLMNTSERRRRVWKYRQWVVEQNRHLECSIRILLKVR